MSLLVEALTSRYQLIAQLGEGSMGAVFRAHDRLARHDVALKRVVLEADGTDNANELRLALAHEFRTLAGLRHPHIISVLDYGFDAERQPFFTMELIEGAQTLFAFGQGLTVAAKVDLLIQALEALAYLHRRGVLHHDLKPENMLVAQGQVRLLDFGLAVLASQQRSDDAFGTLQYLAPEVIDGQPYTEQADLFSLGVVAYELLVGHHPFPAATMRSFLDQLYSSPPNLESLADQPALAEALGQLLAKTPQERLGSAQTAISALRAAAGLPEQASDAAVRESYLQAATFVGRAHELAQLTAALEQARQGQGGAFLIGGESGVGKSRLLDELRSQALVGGFTVLRGQAVADGGQPYQIWREPLRQLLVATPTVDHHTASVLRQIVPDIEQLLGKAVYPAPELQNEAAQQRLFLAIARLVMAQPQPTLLVLEDLHWVEESLLPLQEVLRSITNRPFLIISTYRNDERPDLPQVLPTMQAIALPRLDGTSMSQLSAAMLGELGHQPHIVAFLQRETEGNAFFAVELVRALAEEAGQLQQIGHAILPEKLLPQGIQDIVQRRVAKVPAEGQPLLRLAAVAGRWLDLALLSRLSDGVDIEHWWLPRCADAAILETSDNQWRFSHDKIREALLVSLAPETRAAYHRQVAAELEQLHGADPAYAATLAAHWGEARDQDREKRYAQRAGAHAQAQFLFPDALRWYERVYELLRPATTALELQENVLLINTLSAHIIHTDAVRAYTLAAEAKDLLGAGGQNETAYPRELAICLRNMARALNDRALFRQALTLIEQALQLSRALGDLEQQVDTLHLMSALHWRLGKYDAAEQSALEMQAIGQSMHNQAVIMQSCTMLAMAYEMLDRPDEEIANEQKALQIARDIGNKEAEARILSNHSVTMLNRNRVKESLQYSLEAAKIHRETGNIRGIIAALENIANSYLMDGQHEKAWQAIEESLHLVEGRGFIDFKMATIINAANWCYSQKQYAKALDYLAKAQGLVTTVESKSANLDMLRLAVQIYEAVGDHERATIYQEKLRALG